jgi:uncharacterized protein (TIGR00251 family)
VGPDQSPGEEAELRVRLQPKAGENRIVGERDGALVVRVTAPPLDGKANEALRKLIAKRAGAAKSRVAIVRGAASRDKLVRIEGITQAALRRALDVGPASES